MYTLSSSQVFLFLIFLLINGWVLWLDFMKRRIPNSSLILLFSLLPFWYYLFPPSSFIDSTFLLGLSLSTISLWVIFHKTGTSLGSWDIKYIGILILFFTQHPLVHVIYNIGVLTLFTLLLWWGFILGGIIGHVIKNKNEVFYFRRAKDFIKDIQSLSSLYSHEDTWTQNKSVYSTVFGLIFDWFYIGFLLYLLLPRLIGFFFEHSLSWQTTETYIFLSIVIFLIRPILHSVLFRKTEYVVLSLILGSSFVYFLANQKLDVIAEWMLLYIQWVWKFILWISLIAFLTSATFRMYKNLLWIHYQEHTFPYSIIIFCWAISAMVFEKNLIEQLLQFLL